MHPFKNTFASWKQAVLFLSLFSFSNLFAQTNEWTWISGSQTPNQIGSFGTKGVSDPGNVPGGRTGAIEWQDASGNLWLMGGFGYSTSTLGNLNDLWKYSPTDNEWTWISGDNSPNQASVFGTQGAADVNNKPGARSTAVSFMAADGTLWLMGGFNNSGILNDLWKFDPSTLEWTWVSGDKTINKTGVYGTKGTADINNKPGARYSSASFVDADGNFWLFGGYGYATSGGNSFLNDLWKFNPSTNEWTWVSGDNTSGQAGIYGTKDTPDIGNKPGGRYSAMMWMDNGGNIWIFGGNGYATTTPVIGGCLNDLWKFNPTTGEWTWVSGDNATDKVGVYGTKGTAASTNKPGGRYASGVWQNTDGSIYIFGGSGYPFNSVLGNLSDLWKWDSAISEWTWIGGSNLSGQQGLYGTKGASAPTNVPGSRNDQSSWLSNGTLMMFGGSGKGNTSAIGYLNDLWSYDLPDIITLPVQFNSFTAHKDDHTVLLNWSTAQEQNSHHFSIERSSDGVSFESIGSVAAAGNSSSILNYDFIDVAPSKGVNFYRIEQFDIDGHSLYSKIVSVTMEETGFDFVILQNPVSSRLWIKLQVDDVQKLDISIKNANGSLLMKKEVSPSDGNYFLPVDQLSKGIYYITVSQGNTGKTKTFVKL